MVCILYVWYCGCGDGGIVVVWFIVVFQSIGVFSFPTIFLFVDHQTGRSRMLNALFLFPEPRGIMSSSKFVHFCVCYVVS